MNKVMNVIRAVSDADLKIAMSELKTLRDTAVLCDGVVRRVAADLTALGVSDNDALKVAKTELVEAAAFKWAGLGFAA